MQCPGHLAELAPVEEQVREYMRDGLMVITREHYEYLTEEERGRQAKATLSDVQTVVLPLPRVGGVGGAATATHHPELEGFESEEARTMVVLPEVEFHKIMAASYPEMDFAALQTVQEPAYYWRPSPNFTNASRTSSNIYYVINHTTEGSFEGSLSWLRDGRSQASCHPMLPADGSQVSYLVADEDVAWTALQYNPISLNYEHVGYANRGGFVEKLYQTSARWKAAHMTKYKIPIKLGFDASKPYAQQKGRTLGAGIIGHHHVPYPSSHTDPGPYWDWEKDLAYTKRYAEGDAPTPPKPSPDPVDKLYRVKVRAGQAGAFKNKQNALDLEDELDRLGADAYVE